MGKYFVSESFSRRVDPKTGYISDYSEKKEVVKVETEPFFLTYSKQIIALYSSNILNATTKVLYKLLEFSEWNTGKVYMTAGRTEEIMQICGLSKSSYYRAIDELLNIGLISKEKGCYIIQENMFWKGDRAMRDQVIRAKMKVSFSPVFEEEKKKRGRKKKEE